MHELINRISSDPEVCFGKPCIKETRIWVSMILDLLADGMTFQQIINEYPSLKEDDIRAAIAYAAEVTREKLIDITNEAA